MGGKGEGGEGGGGRCMEKQGVRFGVKRAARLLEETGEGWRDTEGDVEREGE